MATRSAPPRSAPPRSTAAPPQDQQHFLETAAANLSRDLESLKDVVSALEKEAGQAAAEASAANARARAAEVSAAASYALNSELRGKFVKIAADAANEAELLASAIVDAASIRERLTSAARKVDLTEASAASSEAHAREMEQLASRAQCEATERAREAEEWKEKAAAALAREKAANEKVATLDSRLRDERKAFQESMASFGQFGGMAPRGWGR